MNKSTFGLHAVIVVVVAILAAVWLSTKPGNHEAMNLFIGGIVTGYLKLAYDADQAKLLALQAAESAQKTEAATQIAIGELVEVKGKLHRVGEEVDGKLAALLAAAKAQHYAEGRLQEAAEERERQLAATALLVNPVVILDQKADELLHQTTIIADNTTLLAETVAHAEDGTPIQKNPFMPPDKYKEDDR